MIPRWNIAELRDELAQWRSFEECILHDVRFVNFGYGVALTFNYVWGSDGAVRTDVLENPKLVTLELLGVESLEFVGALTSGMKASPNKVGWGLAEVARVIAADRPEGLRLVAEWESERRLAIDFLFVRVDSGV